MLPFHSIFTLLVISNHVQFVDSYRSISSSIATPNCGAGCERFIFDDAVQTHGARCLDGSPPGLYFRPGIGSDVSNYLVYSHGGSWCYDLNGNDTSSTWNCALRASTYEGSSKFNPPDGPPRQNMDRGIMSTDCTLNPRFCKWSVVYFMYCDGSSFSGDREEPQAVNGSAFKNVTQVWYRGRRNLQALWSRMLDPITYNTSYTGIDIRKATSVIVTGASAGGFMTFYHCDYIRSLVPISIPLRCVSDCGFWPDFPTASGNSTWHQSMERMMNLHNASGGFDASCAAAHSTNPSYCAHPPNVLPYITTPIFVSTSHQDTDATSVSALADGRGDGYVHTTIPPSSWTPKDQQSLVPCFTSESSACSGLAASFFKNWTSTITKLLLPATLSSQHGYFVNRCYRHHNIDGTYTFTTKIRNVSLIQSIGDWVFGVSSNENTTKLIDSRPATLACLS
eukprot:m.140846 g.140846  ORF g.140846 m.140846 type:complete len:451 (+) comp30142_c0_seq1:212-1564(+)